MTRKLVADKPLTFIGVNLPTEQHDQISLEAAQRKISRSALIREMIATYFDVQKETANGLPEMSTSSR